jgi:hypothetical protein
MIKHILIFILPVFVFDGCMNPRDPCYYVGKDYALVAAWSDAPLCLVYRHRHHDGSSFQLGRVTEFKIGDRVYAGRAESHFPPRGEVLRPIARPRKVGDYFIVDRSRNVYELYATAAQRDKALATNYGVTPSDLWDTPWYASLQAGTLYPWNLLYYGVAFTAIVIYHRWRKRRSVRDQRTADGDEGIAGSTS